MKNNFEELENEKDKAPEDLKNMVLSEVDFIRNTMSIVNMFLGVPFFVGKTILLESSKKNN